MEIINCKYVFNELEIKNIIELYYAGMSLLNIGKQFNVKNKRVIRRVLLENNIKLRSKADIAFLDSLHNKQTCKQKYGVDNVFQLESVKKSQNRRAYNTMVCHMQHSLVRSEKKQFKPA